METSFRDALIALNEYTPVPWAMIPDLGLYMDQVVTFIGRVYAPLYSGDVRRFLTPSMVNNYVKARLIPRPEGKKYSREQLALLIMIVVLKQTSSMDAIRCMLTLGEGDSVEALYGAFCRRLTEALRSLTGGDGLPAPLSTALDYAILASACSAASGALLESDEEGEAPTEA